MNVRKYRPSDCGEMIRLFYDTVHCVNAADYTPAQLDAWADGQADEEAWNRSFLAHFTAVSEENGQIVGFADMDESGHLDRLFVRKDAQGRGIAAALCDALEPLAAGKIVTHASVTAKPFFLKRNYTVIREQQVLRRGVWLTNFVMEKTLPISESESAEKP